jgi:hypothetical protein
MVRAQPGQDGGRTRLRARLAAALAGPARRSRLGRKEAPRCEGRGRRACPRAPMRTRIARSRRLCLRKRHARDAKRARPRKAMQKTHPRRGGAHLWAPPTVPKVPRLRAPGCPSYVGTGAHPYVGTKNVPLERPLIERERDARAKDRKAKFIAAFEQRWPTAAADNRQRTGYAAEALSEDEEKAALDGIGPFLENLKRLRRTNVPAGWNYLEEKRWTLLEAQKAAGVAGAPPSARRRPRAMAVAARQGRPALYRGDRAAGGRTNRRRCGKFQVNGRRAGRC